MMIDRLQEAEKKLDTEEPNIGETKPEGDEPSEDSKSE